MTRVQRRGSTQSDDDRNQPGLVLVHAVVLSFCLLFVTRAREASLPGLVVPPTTRGLLAEAPRQSPISSGATSAIETYASSIGSASACDAPVWLVLMIGAILTSAKRLHGPFFCPRSIR